MPNHLEILKKYFGFDFYRGPQQAIIERTLKQKHSLVIMPTGSGKSLTYQIPALLLEDQPHMAARLLELAECARQVNDPAPGIAPYKGLLFFNEADSTQFFGREALTAHLVEHLNNLALLFSLCSFIFCRFLHKIMPIILHFQS